MQALAIGQNLSLLYRVLHLRSDKVPRIFVYFPNIFPHLGRSAP